MIDKDFEMAPEIWHPVGNLVKDGKLSEAAEMIKRSQEMFMAFNQSPWAMMMHAVGSIQPNQRVSHDTVKYGQLVQAAMPGGGFSPQCKVHFFNKRGVLIGNLYEFIPYERLRLHHKGIVWERIAIGKTNEPLRQWIYETLCKAITVLLKITQRLSR